MTERQQQITALAAELFAKYVKQQGWTFTVEEKLSSLGVCNYSIRRVSLNAVYVETADWNFVEDTLRHEIAHVIAGPEVGHGPKWKMIARYVGANPEACKDASVMNEEFIRAKYKYQMVVVHDDGEVEILKLYGNRRTNLKDKFVVGRRETKNKLAWVKL